MTVEMAEDMGLIPKISPYKKTWYGDRYKTNEEIIREEREKWTSFGFNEKTRTVDIGDEK